MDNSRKVGIGFLILALVGIMVGLPLIQTSAGYVGTMTQTRSVDNQTVAMPANGASVELLGQNVVGTPIVTNATSGAAVPANNYTIAQGVGSDGMIALKLTNNGGYFGSTNVNVSYGYEPDGYVGGAGGGATRAVATLIILFSCMGLAFIVFPDIRNIFG